MSWVEVFDKLNSWQLWSIIFFPTFYLFVVGLLIVRSDLLQNLKLGWKAGPEGVSGDLEVSKYQVVPSTQVAGPIFEKVKTDRPMDALRSAGMGDTLELVLPKKADKQKVKLVVNVLQKEVSE